MPPFLASLFEVERKFGLLRGCGLVRTSAAEIQLLAEKGSKQIQVTLALQNYILELHVSPCVHTMLRLKI